VTAVLIPTASEAEWLEARRQGVTASEIAVILGLSPYSSPYALYHQKTGTLPPQEDSAVMERGRVLEPYIAGKFAEMHPELALMGSGRELFAHSSRRWQLATPDRFASEALKCPPAKSAYGTPVGVVECKVDGGSDEWGEEGTDEIPVHYRAQVLWQCDVMNVSRWYAAALRVRDWRIRVYTGEIDDDAQADLKLMRGEARDFLDRVDTKDEPDVDWRPATIKALKTLYSEVTDEDALIRRSLATQYRTAVRRYKEAERRKDEMTARILEAMGNARYAVDIRTEERLATRSVSHPRRIDTDRLRSCYPAAAADCTRPPKPEVKLTPAKPKKEKS
jgi:putative phage-type endonuclease